MSKNYTRLTDTISSKEGKGYITINGENRELFEISSAKAQLDMKVQARQMLGHRMVQHKVIGAEGTGSLTLYFMNSDMLKLAVEYIKNGTYGGIKLQLRNEDEQSTVGAQEVALTGVILNTIPVAVLDDSSDDPITIDTDFTFDDIDPLELFQLPANRR